MSQQTLTIICFDVANDKRLRKIANELENVGQRVQYSVFECYLDPTELQQLKVCLQTLMDEQEDHVRYYQLCNQDRGKILIDGIGEVTPNHDYHFG
jgi:CRISPR-associated protein Cas2